MERKLLQNKFWRNAGASLLLFFLCQLTFGQQRVPVCNNADISKYKDIQVKASRNCNGVLRYVLKVNGRTLVTYYNGAVCNATGTVYIGETNTPLNFTAHYVSGSASRPWNPRFYTVPGGCNSSFGFDDNQTGQREAYISITGVLKNEAPIGNSDSYTKSICPSKNVKLNVLANDTDKENDALNINRINTQPVNGSATVVDGGKNIKYTPNLGFDGTDSFTYVVCDSQGGCSSPVNVQINVRGNAAPKFSTTSLENTCPVSSVNLRSIHSGTTPSGTTLVFSKDNDPSNGLSSKLSTEASKAVKQSGTYYAYYENNSANCYSLGRVITVNINSCNAIPRITNNGSKETNSLSIVENFKGTVIDMNAKDNDGDTENDGGLTWSFAGGTDVSDFNLNKKTGIVTFKNSPNYENPHDKDLDNVYEVNIKVIDSKGDSDEQLLKVKITNILECVEGSFGGECDEDKDGIINRDDLDDDNDGILDVNECSLRATSASQRGGAADINNAKGTADENYAILRNGDHLILGFKNKLKKGDGLKIYWKKTNQATRFRLTFSTNGKNFISAIANIGNGDASFKEIVEEIIVPIDNVSHIQLSRTAGVPNIDAVHACSGDLDKDGIPDYFDTDSDNDGCADALEAGANFKASDIDDELRLKGGVDKKGIPKVAGSNGQLSLTAYDATKISLECNEAPEITNNGGATTNELDYIENMPRLVVDMNVTDADGDTEGNGLTWDISGGADQNAFEINSDTGNLSFKTSPDFENPTDANKDNAYIVQVRVTDSATAADTQTLTVNVLNALECESPLKLGPECDFDEDGIINKDDLDDDNDGVLDTKEVSIYGMNATQKGGARNIDRANEIPDGRYAVLGKGDFVTLELAQTLNKGDISTIYWRKTNGKGRIRVDFSSNGSIFTNLTGKLNISTKNKIIPRNITIPKDGVTHIRIRRAGGGNIGVDAVVATGGDQDKDGLPDQFDADSDGDGCFDASESGGVDANNDGFLDGTGISDKGLVIGGTGAYNGTTNKEYEAIEIIVDTKNLKNKTVNATTGLELFVIGEASKATSYANGTPMFDTKGNANESLKYQWYIEESGNLNKLSNNAIYEGVTTEKLTFKEDLPIAEYKYVLEVTNEEQSCFEESYEVRVTVDCEIKGDAVEVTGISPTTCTPANDGRIEIKNLGLLPNTLYKINYTQKGFSEEQIEVEANSEGRVIIEGLVAGEYEGIKISSKTNSSCDFAYESSVLIEEKAVTYFEVNNTKVDETYIKAKDGVIVVSVTGISDFIVSVKNESEQEMSKVSDYSYESLSPGTYKVRVTDNIINCYQEEEVEIRPALPPDFEIGFRQLNSNVKLFKLGENPINFILRIGEIENERSNPEPVRIIIAKIPHFKLKYDPTLTKLGNIRRLKNKEWEVSENDKAYFLTYTPTNSSDEIKNEVHDIGITGTFEITPESVAGVVNLLIAIDQESGGEENPKNNLVDIPIIIEAE